MANYIVPLSVLNIGVSAFDTCYYLTSITLPPDLINIEKYAFSNCSQLKSINIPSKVKIIDEYAFFDCSSLTSIKIPQSVTSIGEYAFAYCYGIKSISIPDSVSSIKKNTFQCCGNMTSIYIPSSIKSIGEGAFDYCYLLDSVYLYLKEPVILDSELEYFRDVNKNSCNLFVPCGIKESYLNSNIWGEFLNIVEMPCVNLSQNSLYFTYSGGFDSLIITSSVFWNLSCDQLWLSISPNPGTGNRTIIFKVEENSTLTTRTAMVTVSIEGAPSQTISITQAAGAATLSLSTNTLSIGAIEGSQASVEVTSNTTWTARSDQAWLTINPTSGNDNGTLTFTAQANPTITSREAMVSVSASGVSSQTISITQAAGAGLGLISELKEKVNIYPNPATNAFGIRGFDGFATIKLTDLNGKILLSKEITCNKNVSISSLPKGLYIVKIATTEGSIEKKLLKE